MFMMQSPKVSIVITAFNRPDGLRRAVAKAAGQTYENIEIVVCDDCSTKDLSFITDVSDRVRYFRNDKNMGCSANTLKGLNVSSGEYVMITADDDVLDDDTFIEQSLKYLCEYDAVFGRCTVVAGEKNFLSEYPFKDDYTGESFLQELMEMGFDFQRHISLSSFIFNREKLINVRPFKSFFDRAISVDIAAMVKFSLFNDRIRFIDTSVYKWKKETELSISGVNRTDLTYQARNLLSAALDIYFIEGKDTKSITNAYTEYCFEKILSEYYRAESGGLSEKVLKRAAGRPICLIGDSFITYTIEEVFEKNLPDADVTSMPFEQAVSLDSFDKDVFYIIASYDYKMIYHLYKKLGGTGVEKDSIFDLIENK